MADETTTETVEESVELGGMEFLDASELAKKTVEAALFAHEEKEEEVVEETLPAKVEPQAVAPQRTLGDRLGQLREQLVPGAIGFAAGFAAGWFVKGKTGS